MSEREPPKSDVDIVFLAKEVGKAKEAFEKPAAEHDHSAGDTGRVNGGNGDGVGDSIKLHVPNMALRPEGEARNLDAAFAKDRVAKEVLAAKFQNTKKIAKILQSSREKKHNKTKGNDFEM